jgi:hypothetical protein
VAGRQPAEHVHLAGPAHGLRRLGVDVVGVLVARVGELAVALRVPLLERLRPAPGDVDGQRRLAALDAHLLCGHADVGGPVPQQLGVGQPEVGVAVDAGGHVEPFDEDRAVEVLGLRRAPHDDPGAVGRSARRRDRPASVLAQLPLGLVGGRLPVQEELLLDVAVALRDGRRHGVERLTLGPAGDGTGHGGPGHVGPGHRSVGIAVLPAVAPLLLGGRPARRAGGHRRHHAHQHKDQQRSSHLTPPRPDIRADVPLTPVESLILRTGRSQRDALRGPPAGA